MTQIHVFHLNGLLQSEEDLALKQQLELYVERAQDSEEGIQRVALEAMRYTEQSIGWSLHLSLCAL